MEIKIVFTSQAWKWSEPKAEEKIVDVEDILFRFGFPIVGAVIITFGFLFATGVFPLSQTAAGVIGGAAILVTTIALFPSFIFWAFHLGQR